MKKKSKERGGIEEKKKGKERTSKRKREETKRKNEEDGERMVCGIRLQRHASN